MTEAALNSGQRFIVILPHGAFTVSYYYHKGKGKQIGRIQMGRRVNGKVQNRTVELGTVGHITRQRLWEQSLVLQEKLAVLEAKANAANSVNLPDGTSKTASASTYSYTTLAEATA
ncbi:MAG: hypothetical protein H6656_19000 [Ardenticatenaceae bacterium]|nr:hypothetical protein [Ardenticatenaceae bacterium]